eukprot:5794753-Prymnesium_polylepis.1
MGCGEDAGGVDGVRGAAGRGGWDGAGRMRQMGRGAGRMERRERMGWRAAARCQCAALGSRRVCSVRSVRSSVRS